jgi:Uma2 family endonuclease
MAAETPSTEQAVPGTQRVNGPKLYEVVDGLVVDKPEMGALESVVASVLLRWLAPFVDENRLGRVVAETLFVLDPAAGLKRRPDLAFVSRQRWPLRHRIPRTEAWDVVPDLAVEVISKTNSADEVDAKIDKYFKAGVLRVWLVYPGTSKVYDYESPSKVRILQIGDDLESETLLPGFRLPLNVVFLEGLDGPDPGLEAE